ncbi:exocyst complex component 1-like isoform X1 [Mytilus californianus]|uniref:exocyst complex component 1-like isoform X1 n=1 Tax=Mytilus californianus TaxID=6549 RepID=UPI0022460E39|nr:exocyst complex component 1-like isoform X1 [Mytilus californianus]XP_052078761.1 exocyst complex component 1-like isoform X1 [Mytilus californianus]
MTAIKHTLHRDVFLPNDEQLVAFVHVTKVGRKKKNSFLCAVLSTDITPIQPRVYQVKKADKGESYKKKLSWLLRELKTVDGKSTNKETAEFDLHFEKIFKWSASSVAEKESFLSCLWKLSQRYLIQKADFVNVPRHLLQEVSRPTERVTQAADDIEVLQEDYQALSSKEESDLDQLMSECQAAISNAEVFSENLSKQLSVLDGANIHSIMGSEDQVLNLMRLLDDGINQAESIEGKLESYDNILQNVKEQMEVMKDKDTLIKVRNTNHQKLLEELDNVVTQLDLDTKHLKALQDGELSTPNGIYECTAAALALHKCVNINIHPALTKMAAVEEQQKKFTKFAASFAKRLAHHLNNLFIHQGNEMGETLSRQAAEYKLTPHHTRHRDLTPYAELMAWLKAADSKTFTDLSKVYTESLSKLYKKEVLDFIEFSKQRLTTIPDRVKLGAQAASMLSGSSTSLQRFEASRKRSGSMQSVDSGSVSFHGSDADIASRHFFDQVLDKLLSELEPFCLAEQDFCVRFFHLIGDPMKDEKEQVNEEEVETGDIWMPRKEIPVIEVEHVAKEYFMENLGEGLYQKRRTVLMRQINEEVRKMMGELFTNLEEELEGFIFYADKLDGFYSMYMLVRMSQHVNNAQDAGSFLSVTFASCLVKIKRNFDKFIQNQIAAIEDYKVQKKSRCGIIGFVHNFGEFASQAESIFKGSDRHTHLDKSYSALVKVVFQQIDRVSTEHGKTPREVVMLENFHHMGSVLSQLKIPCLDGDRKEAKQVYQDNLSVYTTNLLGRPLEKIQVFFEGVESKIASGVKPEEVGYQLAFSKQELRKVIKEYSGKEVKKGLDHVYKKVEKHLCEEENLLQVVWFSMQEEFIKQIKHYEDLINKCYPDSGISLSFSVTDVLQFFSEIAQAH